MEGPVPNPVRVVLIGTGRRPIPPEGYGGIERTVAELATALRGRGADVEILNQVIPGKYTRGWRFERHLPRLLKREAYDVLHAHTGRAAWVLGWWRLPYIYTTHTPSWLRPLRLHQRVLFERERQAVRWAQATIATTSEVGQQVERVPRRRGPVIQIPIGVDAERFRSRTEGEAGRALGVGTVERRKRWDVAARAVSGTSFKFTLVGPIRDPSYADELRHLGVEVVGEVSEHRLVEEFERAEVVLHPSEFETTGFVGAVAQALSCSRPVIGGPAIRGLTPLTAASNESNAVERFLHDSLNSFEHNPDLMRRFGKEGRELILRDYSWGIVADRHLNLYQMIAAKSRVAKH